MAISRKNKKITKNNKKIKVKTTLKRRINKKTRYVRKIKGGGGVKPNNNNDWNKNNFEPERPAGSGTVSLVLPSNSASGATAGPASTNSAGSAQTNEEKTVETNTTIIVKHPQQHHGNLPGEKTTMKRGRSHTDVQKKEHTINAARNISYELNKVLDTVIEIIKKYCVDITAQQWKNNNFDNNIQKNQILNKLPKFMRYLNYNISNNDRIEKIKDFSNRANFNAHGKFKKKINLLMKRGQKTPYEINLLDEMYNFIVYIIYTEKNEYHEDVDKMIALLSLLLQSVDNHDRHKTIMDYLESKTIVNDGYEKTNNVGF